MIRSVALVGVTIYKYSDVLYSYVRTQYYVLYLRLIVEIRLFTNYGHALNKSLRMYEYIGNIFVEEEDLFTGSNYEYSYILVQNSLFSLLH